MADYVTYSASISATANSTAVTGSGTAFVTDGVRSGDIAYFIESTGPVGYVIASVESATGLTLATEYEGSTAGSKTVVVTRRYGEESAADTYRLLNSYVQSLEDTVSVSQAGIKYAYSSTTAMADPGNGLFRLNNASAASATAIAIADECGETGNPDASAFINAFDDSTSSIKGYLYIKKAGSPQTFMVYAITALSDNSGWSQLTVTYITGSGSLTNNDAVRFEFYRTGNDGFENGLKYSYSTTTTDSDPGAGIFRFNNATFASITSIYIDNADFNSVTVTTLLDSWDDSANATNKGTLRFQKVGDPTVFREFTINGAITDGTGYRKIPVTPSVSNGTWTNGNNFVVLFTRTGDDGTDGYDPGFRFAFSTTTTDSDPGAGTVRFDNANAALATYAYIDNADAAAADITAWLDGMDDSTESNHKGYLRIQKIGDPAIYREFVVTGTVVNGTGYRKVPIDLVAEAGSFSNGMGIVAHFTRTGSAGTNGTNGTDGYQSGYRLTYSTTTTAADPGAGTVRMNNLVMPSVTAIYIDNTDATGATITTWLDGLDDSDSAIRGYLRFQEATDPANYAEFGVNGAVVDSTGYRTVPVVAISSSGSWSNGDTLVATFYKSGSSGVATIADGSKGDITVSGGGSVWEMTAATPLADLKTKWTPASAVGAASLAFGEDTDNGTNKATLKAPESLASDATVTLPSATGTLATLAGTETLTNKSVNALNGGPLAGFRNAIINGNFDIWQRGTSQTSNGYGSDDRWNNGHGGSTKTHSRQTFTVGQTDVPGNPKYFSRTVVTSSAGAGNYALKAQPIEGVQTFAGETVTVSFYAKANAAKNIAIEFYQGFGSGGSPSSAVSGIGVTTIALTTLWQRFTATISIPSISGKTIGSNGDDALLLHFWFEAGSSFNSRTNSLGQQSGTFDFSGIQVEPGSVATPFERRPPQAELALCQRYYCKSFLPGTTPAQNAGRTAAVEFPASVATGGLAICPPLRFPVSMRAVPTITTYSPSAASAQIRNASRGENTSSIGGLSGDGVSVLGFSPNCLASASQQVGDTMSYHFTADAEL
jgi:hypothetical protein